MKKALCLTMLLLLAIPWLASSVELSALSLGFHLIPGVERTEETRPWDLSLSFSADIHLDARNSIEVLALVDSRLTSFGTDTQFSYQITDHMIAGAGMTVLWQFSPEQKLLWPITSAYAHAAAREWMFPELWVEAGLSFPLLTLARTEQRWDLLPMAELPALRLSADASLVDSFALQFRMTLQPVITSTALLQNPIGRISDELLVLPMGSAFLRFTEPFGLDE